MASNRVRERARNMKVVPTDGGVLSGDPVLFGRLGGVAVVNKASDNSVVIDTLGEYNLTVKGSSGAIAAGDNVFYKVGATPVLGNDNTGVLFGTAVAAVGNAATAVIAVRLTGVPDR